MNLEVEDQFGGGMQGGLAFALFESQSVIGEEGFTSVLSSPPLSLEKSVHPCGSGVVGMFSGAHILLENTSQSTV